MTTIFTEDFSGGTNGAQLSTSNTSFTSFAIPADITFSNTNAVAPSSLSARVHATTSTSTTMIDALSPTNQAVVYTRLYLWVATLPAANTAIVSYSGSASTDAELQLTTTGTIRIRNSALVAVATSTSSVPTGAWCRIEWMVNHTSAQQQVKIWSTSPSSTGTPDYDSGVVTATSANGPEVSAHFGINNATTADLYFAQIGISNSGFLGPVSSTDSSTITAAATAGASLTPAMTALGSLSAASTVTTTVAGTHSVLGTEASAGIGALTIVSAVSSSVLAAASTGASAIDQITRPSAIGIVASAHGGMLPLLAHFQGLTADGHAALAVFGVVGQVGSVTLRAGGTALQFLPAGFGLTPFGTSSFGGTLITALVWQYTATGWQQLTTIKRWNDSTQALEDSVIYAY